MGQIMSRPDGIYSITSDSKNIYVKLNNGQLSTIELPVGPPGKLGPPNFISMDNLITKRLEGNIGTNRIQLNQSIAIGTDGTNNGFSIISSPNTLNFTLPQWGYISFTPNNILPSTETLIYIKCITNNIFTYTDIIGNMSQKSTAQYSLGANGLYQIEVICAANQGSEFSEIRLKTDTANSSYILYSAEMYAFTMNSVKSKNGYADAMNASNTFNRLDGVLLGGGEISRQSATSYDDCATKARGNLLSRGFVYFQKDNSCVLMANVNSSNRTDDTGRQAISGIRKQNIPDFLMY